jgi:cytochrome c5
MGPDHSQIEIYNESKHGVLFNAQRASMNLGADPKRLTTEDMPIPTCATCHMSGLDGLKVTHDTTERLSYWLFAPVSEQRPSYTQGQTEMQETCLKCHASTSVTRFYGEAEAVVAATNDRVREGQELLASLRSEGLLTPEPFDETIEFLYFDFWHYFGRTAKHGAFMGGADFVQWHGNYELLVKLTELQEMAHKLREAGAER